MKTKLTGLILISIILFVISSCGSGGGGDSSTTLGFGSLEGTAVMKTAADSQGILIILEPEDKVNNPQTNLMAATDKNGNFKFSKVLKGSYRVIATKGKLMNAVKKNVVIDTGTTTISLELVPTGAISGKVIPAGDTVTSGDLSKTFIFIEGTSNIAVTSTTGEFVMENIPVGTYNLMAVTSTMPSFSGAAANIIVTAGQLTPNIEINLTTADGTVEQRGSLSGVVKDVSGTTLELVKVDAKSETVNHPFVIFTDSNGVFNFASLPYGTYTISCQYLDEEEFGKKEITGVVIGSAAATALEVVLERAPMKPVITDVPYYAMLPSVIIQGKKEPDTAIYIDDIEAVAIDSSTSWNVTKALNSGPNQFKVRAQNSSGVKSDYTEVRVYYDSSTANTAPDNPSLKENSPYYTYDSIYLLNGEKFSGTGVKIYSSGGSVVFDLPPNNDVYWSAVITNIADGQNDYITKCYNVNNLFSSGLSFTIYKNTQGTIGVSTVAVENLMDTSATIRVYTTYSCYCRVKYGLSPASLNNDTGYSSMAFTEHNFALSGLTAKTTYYYLPVILNYNTNQETDDTQIRNFTTNSGGGGAVSFSTYATGPANIYIDLYFDGPVWGDSGKTTAVDSSDFNINYTQNGDAASSLIAWSAEKPDMTDNTNSSLSGGDNIIRLFLSGDAPATGNGTYEVRVINNSIFDTNGDALTDSVATSIITVDTGNLIDSFYPCMENSSEFSSYWSVGSGMSRSDTDQWDGNYSIKASAPPDGSYDSANYYIETNDTIAVSSGFSYRISYYARGSDTAGSYVKAKILWYQDSGGSIPSGTPSNEHEGGLATSSQWEFINTSIMTAPGDATHAKIRFEVKEVSGGDIPIYIDHPILKIIGGPT